MSRLPSAGEAATVRESVELLRAMLVATTEAMEALRLEVSVLGRRIDRIELFVYNRARVGESGGDAARVGRARREGPAARG